MRTEDCETGNAMEDVEPLRPEQLCAVFRAQLVAGLEEAARGRSGLFGDTVAGERAWPEADQLRALAVALQTLIAQLRLDLQDGSLVEQFLDLCSMHGESHPGEARLARQFLEVLAGSGEQR